MIQQEGILEITFLKPLCKKGIEIQKDDMKYSTLQNE